MELCVLLPQNYVQAFTFFYEAPDCSYNNTAVCNDVHCRPPCITRLSVSLQDRLTVEAPKRHKVSVHVLSREMDSCEYQYSCVGFMGFIQCQADLCVTVCVHQVQ